MSLNTPIRVLIVDDSTTERVNLRQILQQANYEVIEASSGNQAMQLVIDEMPNLIILDIIMDDGDGYQTCRSIRRNAQTANIPVMMLSSKNNPTDKMWAERQGANAYINKPYTAQDILDEITRLQH